MQTDSGVSQGRSVGRSRISCWINWEFCLYLRPWWHSNTATTVCSFKAACHMLKYAGNSCSVRNLNLCTSEPRGWAGGGGRRNSKLRSCSGKLFLEYMRRWLLINTALPSPAVHGSWISQEKIKTGCCGSSHSPVSFRALTSIFLHVLPSYGVVGFCLVGFVLGAGVVLHEVCKLCLDCEVIFSPPNSSCVKVWEKQTGKSQGEPRRTLDGGAQVGRLRSTAGRSWPQVFQE